MEPLHGNDDDDCAIDDLSIHVETADGTLMFRRAENVGLRENSCIFFLDGKRKGQVMKQGEYLFAVDANGKILNRLDWPRNEHDRRNQKGEVYGYHVFWKSRYQSHFEEPLFDETKYLVWIKIQCWHKDSKDDSAPPYRFGEFKDRLVDITIYQKPEGGFDKLKQDSNFAEHLYLDEKLIIRAALERNIDILILESRLTELCRLFQDDVYQNGMKEILDQGNVRGASGRFGNVEVLCAEMCGYDRVVLEDKNCWISFQLRPGSSNLYVLGMGGTLPQLRNVIKTVVKVWSSDPKSRSEFKPNKELSVL